MLLDEVRVPETPCEVNWCPPDAREAFLIRDKGGPLVDAETGRVILLANLSDDVWTRLVQLPPGADPAPRALKPPPQPLPRSSSIAKSIRDAWRQHEAVPA